MNAFDAWQDWYDGLTPYDPPYYDAEEEKEESDDEEDEGPPFWG